jgi:hypothetical protein
MGRLRELAQLAIIVFFARGFQLGLRTAPLSKFTKAPTTSDPGSEQVSAREVFPQKPITINNPAL